ncbi:hypothetical protein GA0074696_2856 [Micromonospora purpureochromogenes]|uniref:Uncharacterized protein n=1 Tax=Micromonospora purpureochromogenes TaxID=47872 RepID=A0A1C4XUQ9_9ACTN|nr:hypothetical protein [Micromonospora purpureochromogenes]SCF12142.1 hypothetical protein GA0074696_2856 [Micromonospora purpureochromogenes]
MRTEPLKIPTLAGPVVLDIKNDLTGRHGVTVGSTEVIGSRRGHYNLPTTDGGSVAARIRTGVFDPYPTITIADEKYRTGPAIPFTLQLLMVLPFGLIALGSLIGGAIACPALLVNRVIVRTDMPTALKALLMLAVTAVAVMLWAVVVRVIL